MINQLCEHQYSAEWSRRDQLQGAVGMPLTLATVLGSAIVYLYQRSTSPTLPASWLFWLALTGAVLSFVVALYSLVRSYLGYTYRRIPFPSQLLEYRRGLDSHYGSLGADLSAADKEFLEFLNDCYVDATDKNAANNGARGEYLYRANAALVLTLLCAAIASVPVAIDFRRQAGEPQKVIILNLPGGNMASADGPKGPTQQQTTTTPPSTPAKVVIPKPDKPKNIDLRTEMKVPRPK